MRRLLGLFSWLFALVGIGTLAAAFVFMPPRPPVPDPAQIPDGYTVDGTGRLLSRSAPVGVRIPAIGVDAGIVATGVEPDDSIEVPSLATPDLAGWYRYGPSPGEPGSAILVGHVDSRLSGPAVFFRLGDLRKGDDILVDRDDGSTAVFTVDAVRLVAKDEFPSQEVHRAAATSLLRLITCGGRFDRSARSYLDNIIVYASLTGTR
ncbi:MAG: class F sortase [Hamadaea sp.]|uniref:class F sortase n=1 Tax=Hamadaea sp. TaxID=2024425 RepID=UPI0017BBA37D|nr:class F sortase [Hamadaea sp.]NUR73917.1 class F sortase [Hamadaea sp.]NUT19608.1 class F sortase [Hamadaea sp.]